MPRIATFTEAAKQTGTDPGNFSRYVKKHNLIQELQAFVMVNGDYVPVTGGVVNVVDIDEYEKKRSETQARRGHSKSSDEKAG